MSKNTSSQLEKYRKLRRRRGRMITIFAAMLAAVSILIGAVSFYGDHVGDFVIQIEKDTVMSLTLCEKRDFVNARTTLKPNGIKDQTNTSFFDLPLDQKNHPDMVVGVDEMFYSFETAPGGDHSDRAFNSYFAYTFYLKNTSRVSRTVDYKIDISLRMAVLSVDEAIRVMVIRNRDVLGIADNRWIFAKADRDENGKRIDENGKNITTTVFDESYESTIFFSDTLIGSIVIRALPVQEIDEYTVVMWLEGDDPDCTDDIRGGKVMLDMVFSIIS